jgi:branched-chain amino acid transport system substrate-binding protein
MRRASLALTVLACALAGGCGSDSPAGGRIHGQVLTLYSSAPAFGPSAVGAQAMLNGERLALEQIGGRIGRFRIVFKALDDSTVQRGRADPGQTTLNARQAAADPTTVGYLGEFDSGASAVSIPILNRAGIPQLSATNTAVGLTSSAPGASPGEPQKYYPTGIRTYARLVPNDSVEAAAQVKLQKAQGCSRTFVLEDGSVDGSEGAASFQLAARSGGLPLVGLQEFDPRATDYSGLALGVAQTLPDCILISAETENNAVALTDQVAAAVPHAMLFGTDGLAETSYTDPAQGGIPSSLDGRMLITVAVPGAGTNRAATRRFLSAYVPRYGAPQPYAVFGYGAMTLMLDAIARATHHGTRAAARDKVRAAIFATRDRQSVLGTYSITAYGDTTLRRYGAFHVVGGRLKLQQAITG